jgi:PAS domain S-box-containing protein
MSDTFDIASMVDAGGEATVPPAKDESTAEARARKRQQAMVAIGRRASVPADPLILAQDAAALLAKILDTPLYGVATLILPEGNSICQRIWKSNSKGNESQIATEATTPSNGESLAAYVLQVAHPVVVTDMMNDVRFSDVFLRRNDINSAVSVPLILQDHAYGSLAVYTYRKQEFTAEDVLFAESVSHLVATAIARKQAEDSLDQQRCLSDSVMQTVGAMVFLLDTEGTITGGNQACATATGFSMGDLRRRCVWDVLPIPEEAERFKQVFKKLKKEPVPVHFESCLLTKHSNKRHVAWACSPTLDDEGHLASIILTGVDVTSQKIAEERAKQAEQDAEELRNNNLELSEKVSQFKDEAGALNTLRQAPVEGDKTQRRGLPRRAYPYKQKVASIIKGELPEKDAFMKVTCHDIGAGGFSYYAASSPESDEVVVGLGQEPNIKYMTAQVAHLERVEIDGKSMYLIGCSYTGHASY